MARLCFAVRRCASLLKTATGGGTFHGYPTGAVDLPFRSSPVSIQDSRPVVNVSKRHLLPPKPVEAPPQCTHCRDGCVWVLSHLITSYVAVCPWCSEFELPADEPEDFFDADTIPEPTPLDGEKGGE